jgi:hypothetical protein
MRHRSTAVFALVWLACGAWDWEPSPGGEAHAQVERLAQQIISESLLGDDLGPLLDALPSWFGRSGARRRLAERRELLLERLGRVDEWRTSEVLRDERGYFKVRAQFFDTPAGTRGKRPFRGLSILFARGGRRWEVRWIGLWDPRAGTWNVLSDEAPPEADER